MSEDLKVFDEAVRAVHEDIEGIRTEFPLRNIRLARTLQWMLVQFDSLTKKVAELEKTRREHA